MANPFNRRTLLKSAFWAGVCLVWLIMAAALMEVLARAREHQKWRDNPYILKPSENPGVPVAPALRETPPQDSTRPLSLENKNAVAAALQTMVQPPSPTPAWHIPRENEVPQDKEARRRLFFGLNEKERDAFCRLHGETVVMRGKPGALPVVYGANEVAHMIRHLTGSPSGFVLRHTLFSGMLDALETSAGTCLQTGQPLAFEAPLPRFSGLKPLECACLMDGGGCTAQFIATDLKKLMALMSAPDSPWQVPLRFYKPNLKNAGPAGDITTNSLGLRDRERSVPKPAGTFRVLCIGGSTTEMGRDFDSTYPALLEKQLAGRYPGKNIEVINAGCSGAMTLDHFARMPLYLRLEPDLVIGYLGVNDLIFGTGRWQLFGPWLATAKNSALARLLFQGGESFFEKRLETLHKENALANMRLLGALFRERGIPVVFCSIASPRPARLSPDQINYLDHDLYTQWKQDSLTFANYARHVEGHNQLVRSLCAGEQFYFADTGKNIDGGLDIFKDVCHFYHETIPLLADSVFRETVPLFDALLPQ